MVNSPFSVRISPNWEGLVQCIGRRTPKPDRVHFIELFLDPEVQQAICDRFGLLEGVDPGDPFFRHKRHIIVQRFLGYDYVHCHLDGLTLPLKRSTTADTATLSRDGGRQYMELHTGPITNWSEFERYPWPDPEVATTHSLEWFEKNLPDDMCIIPGAANFAEHLTWLMGYETLCFSLYDQRDLVTAISERLTELHTCIIQRFLAFARVKLIWGSDDMGFRSGTLISPADLREFVLPGHKLVAQMVHEAGRLYIVHSCGQLSAIIDDLIDDVGIDGKHSFEDAIESVTTAKERYGHRIALLGGIDMDFMCRATGEEVRQRVRDTLEVCMPGGGYCLGTGNSVANYIPLDNYLAMLDEGRLFGS